VSITFAFAVTSHKERAKSPKHKATPFQIFTGQIRPASHATQNQAKQRHLRGKRMAGLDVPGWPGRAGWPGWLAWLAWPGWPSKCTVLVRLRFRTSLFRNLTVFLKPFRIHPTPAAYLIDQGGKQLINPAHNCFNCNRYVYIMTHSNPTTSLATLQQFTYHSPALN
jgi:hypothetical protein